MTSSHRPTIIILGASYAGLMACARLLHNHQDLNIIVIDAKSHFEQKIRLHETLVGETTKSFALEPVLKKRGVTFIQAQVTQISPSSQKVSLKNRETLSYDYLIYALGSVASAKINGSQQYALHLTDRQSLQGMATHLQQLAKQQGHIVVIGGGLTAIEVCTELATRFSTLKITLISKEFPSVNYHHKVQEHLKSFFTKHGINIINASVSQIEQGQLMTHHQKVINFDLCINCSGLKANPIAQYSHLETDDLGRLVVDEHLRLLGQSNIFVVGDAARLTINQQILRMSCATAMPMGAHAGNNLLRLLTKKPLIAFNFAYFAQFMSLGRHNGLVQIVDAHDHATKHHITGYWAARYKEWICRMTINLIYWELRTGLKLYFWPKQKQLDIPQELDSHG